jgi:hypothetical protein
VESYLALGLDEQRAIVRIVDGTQASSALCSGVFITREWVASAAHCLVIPHLAVEVSPSDGGPAVLLPVLAQASHPLVDLALLKVDPSLVGGAPLEPLRTAQPKMVPLAPGKHAELAGYGISDGRSFGTLRFLVEPVLAIDASLITVTGGGVSGACDGDSGGPLLTRDTNGQAVVAGVLSAGSASCLNDDNYVRLEPLAEWIASVAGPPGASSSCGALDAAGRCLDAAAVWCDAGGPRRVACSAGSACGWSEAEQGYRCLSGSPALCR